MSDSLKFGMTKKAKEGVHMSINYDDMLKFAQKEIANSSRKEFFPFRNRFTHTLRVMKWAEKIQMIEGGDLDVIKTACIFHDIGWDINVNHSIISRKIAEEYLVKNKYNPLKLPMVLEGIENHNLRNEENIVNIESKIIMDADIIDEVGAISVIWDAMAAAQEGKNYYDVYERIVSYSKRYKLDLLKTKTGKRFFTERIEFKNRFIKELRDELFLI